MADAMFANGGVVVKTTTTSNEDVPQSEPYIYAVGGRLRWSSKEQQRMNDVLIATQLCRAMATPTVPVDTNGVDLAVPDVTAFLNSTADTYRAVVEMAKKLNDFCTLTEHQRLSQLRESAPDMSILYNVAQGMNIQWPGDGVKQLSVVEGLSDG